MKKTFLAIVLLGLAAYFVWPTRYEQYPAGDGPHAQRTDYATRVDRLSGEVWYESRSGKWKPLPEESDPQPHRPNPVTEPYTRVDVGEAQRQRQQAETTQKMVDQATDKARKQQQPKSGN